MQYFFVDESGDTTFYNKKGASILGQEGCSPLLIIGFIQACNPKLLREKILTLHKEIAGDAYLQNIPSLRKTKIAFHAKDDVPEVREKVFKLIKTLEFKAEFVVARKRLDIFAKRHERNEDIFYNEIISRLFERKLHLHDNVIYFEKRGNKLKQHHLAHAIKVAILNFEGKYSKKVETDTQIYVQIPSDEPCLQIIDYINWSIQRAYIKSDMRYFNFIKEKISLIIDLYDFDKYPGNFYNRKNVFDIKKISPL